MSTLLFWRALTACVASVSPSTGSSPPDIVTSTASGSSTGPETRAPSATPAGTDPTGDTAAPPAGPAWELADTALFLNIGDSVAAGYDAAGQRGYAKLLFENDDGLAPGFRGADLSSRSGAAYREVAESGATSAQVLGNLRGASLPPDTGPVVATISAGGNDFNDDPAVMLATPLTRAVAADLRANVRAMIDLLRDRYDEVHVYVLDIQDPTDGTGAVPARYEEGMCGVIQAVPALVRPIGVSNLGVVNQALADEAAASGAALVPYHDHFLGHGLPSGDGWMSDDCAHPTSVGHHEIRRVIWEQWTGEAR